MKRLSITALLSATLATVFIATPALALQRNASVTLSGQGSTFDRPLIQSAAAAYHSATISYTANGSGAGQVALNNGLVDFGCFDVPMLKTDGYSNFRRIVQFPITLGGVGVIYNLPGYRGKLKLSGSVLADIYLGKIKSWRSRAIEKIDGKRLPNLKITVVHRSDSSGTSYIFTDYLSHVSSTWAKKHGASKSATNFPVGVGGQGSTNVAALVASHAGAIGYVETSYALETHLKQAYIESRDHTWLQPTLKTIAQDASHIGRVTPTHFSIVYSSGNQSYPISGFSWCGLYLKQKNKTTGRAAVAFFKWLVTSGQKLGPPLNYVKLPSGISRYSVSQIRRVKP